MLQLARPTGNWLQNEGDQTMVEVMLDGKSVYATVCLPFGWYFVPSAQWLEVWAREVVCWVDFEHGNPAHPVVVGYRPLADKIPGADYPRLAVFKTEFYRWEINDAQKKMFLGYAGGLGVQVTQQALTLAAVGATVEPAVLGDKNGSLLTGIFDTLDAICTQLGQLAAGVTALGQPQGATVTAAVVTLKGQIATAKGQVAQTKSQKVKLA